VTAPDKPTEPAAPPQEQPPADTADAITEDRVKLALRRVKDPELNLD
jgi:hypothetical protein